MSFGLRTAKSPTLTIHIFCSMKYEIISAIQLKDLIVTIENESQAYAALINNNETDVTFKNPFGCGMSLCMLTRRLH